jgi:hypothetical protein
MMLLTMPGSPDSDSRAATNDLHIDGYAAVLIQLRMVSRKALREALVDGWLACAPGILADDFLSS